MEQSFSELKSIVECIDILLREANRIEEKCRLEEAKRKVLEEIKEKIWSFLKKTE